MKYLAECRPDTLLVELLTRGEVEHRSGKARLIKRMLRSEDERCNGIIDEDPGKTSATTAEKLLLKAGLTNG